MSFQALTIFSCTPVVRAIGTYGGSLSRSFEAVLFWIGIWVNMIFTPPKISKEALAAPTIIPYFASPFDVVLRVPADPATLGGRTKNAQLRKIGKAYRNTGRIIVVVPEPLVTASQGALTPQAKPTFPSRCI